MVNIWNGGVVNVNWGNSPAYSDGVSGNQYDLNVHEGGRFQTQGGSSYTDGGVGAHTRTEVDGGTLCIGDLVRVGNNANLTPLWNSANRSSSTTARTRPAVRRT